MKPLLTWTQGVTAHSHVFEVGAGEGVPKSTACARRQHEVRWSTRKVGQQNCTRALTVPAILLMDMNSLLYYYYETFLVASLYMVKGHYYNM